jgi:hypothetical protein
MIQKLMTAISIAMLALGCSHSASTNARTTADLKAQKAAQHRIELEMERHEHSTVQAEGTGASQATSQPQDAPGPMNGLFPNQQPERVPAIVAAMPMVGGIGIIGFSDNVAHPCLDNAYERALTGALTGNPMIDRRMFLPKRLLGNCAAVRRSRYWTNILVDNVQMQARYIPDVRGPIAMAIPISYPVCRNGQTRNLPLTPPGDPYGNGTFVMQGVTEWLMPLGTHTITIELYQPAPTGDCYVYVGQRTVTETYPFRTAYGLDTSVISQPENYGN